MSKYCVMECTGKKSSWAEPIPLDDEVQTWVWMSGKRFDDPPTKPIMMEWETDGEHGEFLAMERLSFYEEDPVLMTKELVAALQEAGVTNLDTYEVVIRSPGEEEDCYDYVAVNIIGVIATADMERSKAIDIHGTGRSFKFRHLVIDEEKAKDHLFFRLAESFSKVIVHENIVKYLKQKGGFGLTFRDTH